MFENSIGNGELKPQHHYLEFQYITHALSEGCPGQVFVKPLKDCS